MQRVAYLVDITMELLAAHNLRLASPSVGGGNAQPPGNIVVVQTIAVPMRPQHMGHCLTAVGPPRDNRRKVPQALLGWPT